MQHKNQTTVEANTEEQAKQHGTKPIGFCLFAALWCVVENRPFPQHQQTMARFLEQAWQRGDNQLLLMAFRSSGKSTLVGLFCAWLLYQDNNLRILVLSAEQNLATKMVRAVRQLFDRHPLLKNLKPDNPDQWARDEFTIKRNLLLRDPSMVARGIYGNITGFRADVIICDDVEVINNSYHSDQRNELRRRLAEVDFILAPPPAMPNHETTAGGDASRDMRHGGLQLFVGTPHGQDSIYNTAPDGYLAGFSALLMPLLDKDGHSVWPEKFTPSHIKNLQQRHGTKKFLSQMMLRMDDNHQHGLDSSLIQEYDGELIYGESNHVGQLRLVGHNLTKSTTLNTMVESIGCFWDPAFGVSDKTSDGSVVAVMMKNNDGHFYLHDLHYLQTTGDDNPAMAQIKQVMALMEKNFARGITIENNGLGKFLPSLLRQEIKKQRKLIAVNEVTHRQNKRERIFAAFDSLLSAGALHVHRRLRVGRFYHEMKDFQLQGSGHDDGLDAVAGCIQSQFYKFHGI